MLLPQAPPFLGTLSPLVRTRMCIPARPPYSIRESLGVLAECASLCQKIVAVFRVLNSVWGCMVSRSKFSGPANKMSRSLKFSGEKGRFFWRNIWNSERIYSTFFLRKYSVESPFNSRFMSRSALRSFRISMKSARVFPSSSRSFVEGRQDG